MGTNDRMAAGDAPGMREDDAVSFSGDEDGDESMDAGGIDAEDVAALLDEREAAAPDEPLSLATVARRNLPDDFLELAEPEAIAAGRFTQWQADFHAGREQGDIDPL